MAKRALFPHPTSPLTTFEVAAKLMLVGSNTLKLEFVVVGAVENILIPQPAMPERADGLWQHSCFEMFIGLKNGAYVEFNFSPSGQWAHYRFDSYRAGMADAFDLPAPVINWESDAQMRLMLTATIDVSGLRDTMNWTFGLSSILETRSETKTYWALAHPDGAPDFHHSDCFALKLTAPETL